MNSSSVPDSDFNTKQESSISDGARKPSSSSITTSSWSRLKDPRIVRVSRAFGGKDRHSKVCTVRGLRDRRVRLSVPTAIQLYDLQDRLGLNQPSKVVDWLLNVAKHEIDELPPLQIPEGVVGFGENVVTSQEMIRDSVKEGLKMNDNTSNELWTKSKEFSGENTDREENWGEERQFQETQCSYFTSTSNFLSRPNLLNNSLSIPYNSFVRWDPSNLTLSQPEDSQHFSLYHQPTTNTQSYFVPSQNSTSDSQLSSNFPFTSHAESTTMPLVRPFHFSMVEKLFPRGDQNKDEFH